MKIEAKLQALGLVLPAAPKAPPGITLSFAWTRIRGNRVYVAGHAAQAPDGTFVGPFGKVLPKSPWRRPKRPHGERRFPCWPASSAPSAIWIGSRHG